MLEVTAMQVAASADAEALGSVRNRWVMVKMLENHINVYLYNIWLCYDVGSNGSNVGYDMV